MDNIEKCAHLKHRRLCPINCEWGHNQLLVFEGPNREYQINSHKMYGDWRLKYESNEVSQGLIESEI